MENTQLKTILETIISNANKLIPRFLENPIDFKISDGNVSMCIIDMEGRVYGIMWGKDKVRQRHTYQTAWRKASQVWITGVATGKFEELVYTRKVDLGKYGIQNPDLIGWQGGWPILIDGEMRLAIAVSGMRGETDTEVVSQAVLNIGELLKS
jgi:glc operon protein GlcG